jgi:uncharacterized protein YggE
METLLTNKRFIKASIGLVGVLTLFVLMLFINEVKASSYIGRSGQQPATISVSGTGDYMAVSDVAMISMSVTKEASTTKEAQNLLNEEVTKTLTYLKSQKIDEKDIKSEYGGLNPKYASTTPIECFRYPCPQPESKIVGYIATQSITIKVRDVDTANTVRTGLANLGITDITGPTFSIDNEDMFKTFARGLAIKDAQEKAELLAKQLHVRLGKIITYSEDGSNPYPLMYAKGVAMDSVGAAPTAPTLPKGENKITSNVTITYEIR